MNAKMMVQLLEVILARLGAFGLQESGYNGLYRDYRVYIGVIWG